MFRQNHTVVVWQWEIEGESYSQSKYAYIRIIKTHIRENRFHGNRSVHPQKLPTT